MINLTDKIKGANVDVYKRAKKCISKQVHKQLNMHIWDKLIDSVWWEHVRHLKREFYNQTHKDSE